MEPTDFLLLYQELGLRPGAGIDELKLAYRRRIAALHPDRQSGAPTSEAEAARERLQRLTLLYGAATLFHRRHGRLPGQMASPRPAAAAQTGRLMPPSSALEPAGGSRRRGYAIALGLAIAAACAWHAATTDDDAAAGLSDSSSADVADSRSSEDTATPAPTRWLRVGMPMEDVLILQKEPISRGETRWDYGPSWIEFERGKVSDWYSSSLHPLRHASERPTHGGGENDPT